MLFRRLLMVLALALAPLSLVTAPVVEAAVTYTTAVKNARMTAVRDAWGASAKLKIFHSDGTTVLATFTFSATTADSTVAAGVLTCKFTGNAASQTVVAAATGVGTTAKVTTSGDADVITGLTVSATGGGGDVQLNSTTIGSGANVTITACSFTHA